MFHLLFAGMLITTKTGTESLVLHANCKNCTFSVRRGSDHRQELRLKQVVSDNRPAPS